MITYSKGASECYIEAIERCQRQLAHVTVDVVDYSDLTWLIGTALEDLKREVKREWEPKDRFNRGRKE